MKKAMQFIWKKYILIVLTQVTSSYRQRAFGYDELLPLSGKGDNCWGGVAMTLVDSLDTLWVMGMKEEFDQACEWVVQNLELNYNGNISVFEYNIRLLGGLLSAYDLSGKPGLLKKAKEVGELLKIAFEDGNPLPVVRFLFHSPSPSHSHSFLATHQSCAQEGGGDQQGLPRRVRHAHSGVPLSLQANRRSLLLPSHRQHLRYRKEDELHRRPPASDDILFTVFH